MRRAGVGGDLFVPARRREAGDVAGDAHLFRSGDDEDAVEAATPVAEHAFRLAAASGVALDFEDERGLDDGNGFGVAREDLAHPVALGGDDGGVDDGVEVVEAGSPDSGRKARSASLARSSLPSATDDFGAEFGDDFLVDRLAGLHERAAEFVGLDDFRAQFAQDCGDGALAAAQAAGQSDADHGASAPAGAAWPGRCWP
jgi:hypothetical protein